MHKTYNPLSPIYLIMNVSKSLFDGVSYNKVIIYE